jgi:Domain of unknown function (DUF222)/HNH endonuclease
MCEGIDSVASALRAAREAAEFLNSHAAEADGAGCGAVLTALAEVRDMLTAANAGFLRRFDAAGGHRADAHPTSSSWLADKCRMTRRAAKAEVRQMRVYAGRPVLHQALADGDLSDSWVGSIADWTRKLPAGMRAETDKILVAAAAAGADLPALATIAGAAVEQWRQQQPDADRDRFDHHDRYLALGTTFGGAGVIRGDLTPECAAALTAVLEALGKRRGPADDRSARQRDHDALQEALEMLLAARLVPERAGAPTQAIVHIPIGQLRDIPGAGELEDEWLRARLGEGEPGYLDGKDAQAAACDAQTVPVVTGRADMSVIDKLIALAHASCCGGHCQAVPGPGPGSGPGGLSAEAWRAHRYAIARLAIDFVSGPGGIASYLRTGLLPHPYNGPSLPLDIGESETIPGPLRRAVILRDQHCAFPGGCRAPAAASDVHHIIHQEDGGPTSLRNLALYCKFHHKICIHRWGWQVILHPDGTTEARSPDGTQILHSHAPPLADPA